MFFHLNNIVCFHVFKGKKGKNLENFKSRKNQGKFHFNPFKDFNRTFYIGNAQLSDSEKKI